MTVVLHLTETPGDVRPAGGGEVRLVRHPFAEAIADEGLASVLSAIEGLQPTGRLVVIHPDTDVLQVERLGALLRRSQRRRAIVMISHRLGPLGADLLVERLAALLTDPAVGLDDAAAWCHWEQAMFTDIVWTTRATSRWAVLDRAERLRAWLPGRQVRSQLGLEPHTAITTRDAMLADLQMSGTDVMVGGRDSRIITQTVEQLRTARARSVQVVGTASTSSVEAEVVVSPRTCVRPERR